LNGLAECAGQTFKHSIEHNVRYANSKELIQKNCLPFNTSVTKGIVLAELIWDAEHFTCG